MRRDRFHYDLPEDLIAQRPLDERSASRLLALDGKSGDIADYHFRDVETLLAPADLLVMNDTRVIPARLFGRKPGGGRVEILIEKILHGNRALALVRASKIKSDQSIQLEGGGDATITGRRDNLFELQFHLNGSLRDYLQTHGHVPLPPYIRRDDESRDRDRYQTVYARHEGAIAAPTAGLHFDQSLLRRLAARGIEQATLTLHVGAGTFQPVRTEQIEDHSLHAEQVIVDATLCRAVHDTRAKGGRVVAVGTTVVRALEAAAAGGTLQPYRGQTQLFIYPGYKFRVIDALITNFHLPESSLLMLVSAFAGTDHVLAAYRHAVNQQYRFFSYGDAMFVVRQTDEENAV